LWLYATYHCNLTCSYCLTESSPRIANRRTMTGDAMLDAAREAKALGLTCLGVTGGEVFMLPWFPEALAEMGAILPVVALTNATLFTDRLLDRLQPLADLDVALQISLDSDQPDRNDQFRGPDNFAGLSTRSPSCSTAASASASRPRSSTRPRTNSPVFVVYTAGWASPTTTTSCARSFAAAGPRPKGWASSSSPAMCCPS